MKNSFKLFVMLALAGLTFVFLSYAEFRHAQHAYAQVSIGMTRDELKEVSRVYRVGTDEVIEDAQLRSFNESGSCLPGRYSVHEMRIVSPLSVIHIMMEDGVVCGVFPSYEYG